LRELVEILAVGLGGWRLAVLLVKERGPGDIILKLRSLVGIEHNENGEPVSWPETFLPRLLTCAWCLSIWTTLLVWGLWQLESRIVLVLGAMGLALALEKALDRAGGQEHG